MRTWEVTQLSHGLSKLIRAVAVSPRERQLTWRLTVFWNVGRRHIQDYSESFMGPWAGESIICVSQDTKAGDYPPGILTKDEGNELQESVDEKG